MWVNKQDIALLAAEVGLEVDDFEHKFVRNIGVRKSLVEFSSGDCVFFDNKSRRCEVYNARPRQCRTWPFWDSNLKSPEAWADTCESCPGAGKGKLHDIAHIETERAKIRV